MSWESFVAQTTAKLHNGEPLPSYFGCISNLLTGKSPKPVTRAYNEYSDSEDEMLNAKNSSRRGPTQRPSPPPPKQIDRQNSKKSKKAQKQRNESETSESEQPDEHVNQNRQVDNRKQNQVNYDNDESSGSAGSYTRKEEPKVKKPPPTFDSEDESSISRPQKKPKKSPMPKEEYYNSDEDNQILEKDEQYAQQFRQIGDAVYGRYWAPIEDTVIPRMNLESKLLVQFKLKKFNHLYTTIEEKSRHTGNSILFSRRTDFIEEEEEDEEDV